MTSSFSPSSRALTSKTNAICVNSVTLAIPINYRPRSRPYLPIADSLLPFFSTLKTAPEEWYQVSSSVPHKDKTQSPMDCHLFIPRAQIYALTDTIPFHLQLRASTGSLRLFLGMAPDSHRPTSETRQRPRSPVVRVYLLRDIVVKVKGVSANKHVVLGEGTLSPVEYPPAWSPYCSSNATQDTEEMYALDWEGELSCNDDVTVPSFVSGDLQVRDYIVVHLRPADVKLAAHIEHRHSHTIRFVTDKYRQLHPSDNDSF
ncbi:hypothetical protein BC835DRAFT_1284717 [Cytidiella melzeri]|nr:hypothetical protein BC835DRAFT_1284717 [Cytidiella melzeri]